MQKRTFVSAMLGLVLLLSLIFAATRFTLAQDDPEFTYAGETDAPEFPEGLDWINVSDPLTIDDLEGKIVLLDFWTYGCINCMHIIPDMLQLEEEFGDQLVIIGVHSAKFENEGQTDNIREIVQRYGVIHPVVNDVDFGIWRTYGVRAWPTMVLIDPLGKIVGGRAGEGIYEVFQPILEIMVDEFGAAGLLDNEPLPQLAPEIEEASPTALSYPGKVLADSATNRLIITDTAHHRLIVATLDDFSNAQIIGSGQPGFTDGAFEEAAFYNPQGLAIDGDTLYLADTGNHAIRQIDLATRTVSTLVGIGQQATSYPPAGGTAPNVLLSSPWDLTLHDGVLYIAMAGPHQLWRVDLETGETVAHAGSGLEDIIDGPLAAAQLAQPSGIDTDGTLLYFADSEVSAIRTASIDPDGDVETIVGTGLFDFGDVDGVGFEVRLQHALGVTVGPDGLLYIADTYNNKIKVINPATRESTTFAGDGTPGLVDGSLEDARFYEPGGIDYANGKLYVADTNNHAIRIIDLETRTVSTVQLADEIALIPTSDTGDTDFVDYGVPLVELEAQTVAAGKGALVFDITMPEGYKLNDQAPFTVINSDDEIVSLTTDFQDYREVEPALPLQLPVTFIEGSTVFSTDLTIYWCEGSNQTLCFVEQVTIQVEVVVSSEAETTDLILPYELVPPNAVSDF